MEYTFTAPSFGSTAAFCAILIFNIIFLWAMTFYFGAKKGQNSKWTSPPYVIAGTLIYLGVFSIPILSGLVDRAAFPTLPIMLFSVFIVSVSLALSPLGKCLTQAPFLLLIGFQSFRLPLEIILHQWSEQGSIPVEMSWNGQNLDVIAGILCLLLSPFSDKHKIAAWIANLVGSVLLLNVIRVAVLSSPLPISWPLANPLQLAGHLPYAFIVPVCVGFAISFHVISFRKLLKT